MALNVDLPLNGSDLMKQLLLFVNSCSLQDLSTKVEIFLTCKSL